MATLSFLAAQTRFFRGVIAFERLARVDPWRRRAPEYFSNIVPSMVIYGIFFLDRFSDGTCLIQITKQRRERYIIILDTPCAAGARRNGITLTPS